MFTNITWPEAISLLISITAIVFTGLTYYRESIRLEFSQQGETTVYWFNSKGRLYAYVNICLSNVSTLPVSIDNFILKNKVRSVCSIKEVDLDKELNFESFGFSDFFNPDDYFVPELPSFDMKKGLPQTIQARDTLKMTVWFELSQEFIENSPSMFKKSEFKIQRKGEIKVKPSGIKRCFSSDIELFEIPDDYLEIVYPFVVQC